MKMHAPRWITTACLAACVASSVGCYPGYPPPDYRTAYNQDAKGYAVPQEPLPPAQPRYAGIDPGLAIAGVAAAGILGYAIGNNHGYHHDSYYGPGCYRPVPYGRGYYGHPHY